MSKGFLKFVLGLGAAIFTARPAVADLAAWHIAPGGSSFDIGQYANWTPYGGPNLNNANAATTGNVNGIDYSIWDGYGPHGNANTGSHHNLSDFGGQTFDAKAMLVRNDSANLYVGIITGFNPAGVNWNNTNYSPGDLAINPDFANKTSQFGVVTLTGAAGTSGTTSLVSGGEWNTPNVATGHAGAPYSNILSGGSTVTTNVHYSYTDLGISYKDTVTNSMVESYLMEFSIPLSDLGVKNGQGLSFAWSPSCANDTIGITHAHTAAVPEPASISAVGSLLMLGLARRRPRRA